MKLSIVSSCYNEADNIPKLVEAIEKIRLITDVEKIVLVNNGSIDDTSQILASIEHIEGLHVIEKPKGSTYSEGVLSGLKSTQNTFVLLFHSDLQYCPVNFLKKIHEQGLEIKENTFYFGARKNRPKFNRMISFMLRVIVCKVLKLEYLDYNAQPKLFYNDIDHSKMESLRGFSIDIAICSANRSRNTKSLDSLEANRENGMSSWNLGAVSLVKLAISYLIEIKKIKSLRF